MANPLIFTHPDNPGLSLDMRINVFGQRFHVHSGILKIHSRSIFHLLDSLPQPTTVVGSVVPFDYISMVDIAGEWRLEPLSMAYPFRTDYPLRADFDPEEERRAFTKLLLSIYNIPYQVDSVRQLSVLTRLADVFGTLPTLSCSLHYQSIRKSPGLLFGTTSISVNPETVVRLAKLLRNELLFRDAFTLAIAKTNYDFNLPYRNPFEDDEDLYKLAAGAHHALCRNKMAADHEIRDVVASDSELRDLVGDLDLTMPNYELRGAVYYGRLLKVFREFDGKVDMTGPIWNLERLLRNALELDKNMASYDGFHCPRIEDMDIPWDMAELAW